MTSSSRFGSLIAAMFVLGAVGAFVLQGVHLARHYSPTFDEGAHLVAGYSYWRTADFRINPEHPPLAKLLFALPLMLNEPELRSLDGELLQHGNHWQTSRWFLANSPVQIDRLFYQARLVNLGLGALLVLLIGWWSNRMWGRAAAILSAWLAAFDPTLQAHSCLLTMDVALTLFSTLTFYLLWEFLRSPSPARLIGVGSALGLAVAAKFTAVFIVLLVIVVVGLHMVAGGQFRLPRKPEDLDGSLKHRLGEAIGPLVRIAVIAGLVLAATYFGLGLPAWGKGIKEQLVRAGRANMTYLNGTLTAHGVSNYYPIVFALKTPIGVMLAVGAGLLFALRKPRCWIDLNLLIVPAMGYFALTMFSGIDLGARLILPVFPFLYVLAGRLGYSLSDRLECAGAGIGLGALVITVVSVRSVDPQQIAYFNELGGGPANGYRRLADSNVDWGQDLKALKEEMDRQQVPIIYLSYYGTIEPEWYGIRHQSLPGFGRITPAPSDRVPADAPVKLLAISVNNLLGLYLDDPAMYRWLLDRQPAFRVGYSIHVYDVTDDAGALARIEALAPKQQP
jgi:hypothetical protein